MTRLAHDLPVLALAALLTTIPAALRTAAAKEVTCGDYGTSVVFADSAAEAAKQAIKEEKLVFILHVSGLFEESEYT